MPKERQSWVIDAGMKQDITKGGIGRVQINMWAKEGVLWEAERRELDSLLLLKGMKSLYFSSRICVKEQREESAHSVWLSCMTAQKAGWDWER